MNIYTGIILGTILIGFLLDLIAETLNLRALQTELPEEFQGVYAEEAYRNSQEYTRVTIRFGFITSTFSLVLTLGFWFLGGFQVLDRLVRGWGFHPIVTGLLYIGLLILLKTLLFLPFHIYDTFVIEERFGFNKTTPKTFIADFFKSLGLSILIGGPLLAGLLAFFQYTDSLAWLYCWLVTTVVMLFLHFIAPTWIMPLFNTFTPLEEGELRNRIFDYARSVNFPLENLFVMDGSKRSTKSNAFFTGFGKHKRIAFFDTLIEKHSVAELVSILAHEIGHYKKNHILKNLTVG
ncbi:MAG: M48 family metallopeptidase, partial [Candidatus Vecturithrix sp.]|nr:M48 family metallopeptidase [Candidatus Vecturithrix sp.]